MNPNLIRSNLIGKKINRSENNPNQNVTFLNHLIFRISINVFYSFCIVSRPKIKFHIGYTALLPEMLQIRSISQQSFCTLKAPFLN